MKRVTCVDEENSLSYLVRVSSQEFISLKTVVTLTLINPKLQILKARNIFGGENGAVATRYFYGHFVVNFLFSCLVCLSCGFSQFNTHADGSHRRKGLIVVRLFIFPQDISNCCSWDDQTWHRDIYDESRKPVYFWVKSHNHVCVGLRHCCWLPTLTMLCFPCCSIYAGNTVVFLHHFLASTAAAARH